MMKLQKKVRRRLQTGGAELVEGEKR